ncbi:MAG: AAA family ATPase, partial [Candidatus Omnitrophica bacterium]|nr:AAA family ATPase [Candidatus Omnitrophota bacterium]
MYFKKLEIVGFKSFMEKTTLHFEPGITAVVGPNGCGKSNIFDSIRWVLGEQSVKSLRGSQMEDVIFNGTDNKEALGLAEVSLTFDNGNKFFPVENDEVVITRRIFRSGESEYLLNKATVRLKDILELLMGTGIGAESYSLVPQGKIDMVLSSKPEDRRLVFDEAAGITKYKSQKKEALKKLDETEQNLLRVGDIINEVRRSIGHLERQANKARRYKEVFEELKAKEISMACVQKNNLYIQKEEILKQLCALREKEEALQKTIKEEEMSLEQRSQDLRLKESAITSARNEILNLENNITRDSQHMNFNQERIKELENSRKYLETQVEQTKNRLAQDEEKLNKLKEEETVLKKNVEEKSILLQAKENQLNELIASTKAAVDAIAAAKRNIMDLAARTSQAKNEIVDLNSKKQIFLARKKRLDIEKIKVGEEKSSVEANLNALDSELKLVQESLQALNLKTSELDKTLGEEKSCLNKIDSDMESLERQKSALESHKEFLEKLKTQYESIDTSMNATIYLDKMPAEKISGLVIKVKDWAELKLSGEAKPIDLDTQRVTEKIKQIEDALIVLNNSKAEKEKHVSELHLSLEELRGKSQEQEIALNNKKTFHQAAFEQFTKIKEEEEIILLEISDVETEILGHETKLASLEAGFAELEKEQKAQETLIHTEQEKVNLNANLKEEILIAATKIKTELEAWTRRLNSEDSTLKMLEDTCAQNRESLLNLDQKIRENSGRQDGLVLEIRELENQIAQAKKDIEQRVSSLKEAEKALEEIALGLEGAAGKIEEEKKEFNGVKDRVYTLQMEEKDLDFKYSSIRDRMLQAYKVDLDSQELNNNQGAGGGQDNTEKLASGATDENTLAQGIESLKAKLDSYGNVNLVAIEEYDELKKRYDFLTQQQTDLVTAKASLQEAISKINRTTRKMFVETFEKVAEEFRGYFRLLFNGGDAKVYLIDEHDPLESGIEIICRPPGKKLQNVLLLSGGEKTLS